MAHRPGHKKQFSLRPELPVTQADMDDEMLAAIIANYKNGGSVKELVRYYNGCITTAGGILVPNSESITKYWFVFSVFDTCRNKHAMWPRGGASKVAKSNPQVSERLPAPAEKTSQDLENGDMTNPFQPGIF